MMARTHALQSHPVRERGRWEWWLWAGQVLLWLRRPLRM